MQSSKNKWVKPHHRVVYALLGPAVSAYTRWKCGVQADPFTADGDRAYLILMNHQTAYDQFFVYMSFRRVVYFLATEDIFSMGLLSTAIRWLASPIPIRKQTTDLKAVRSCLQAAKEGGTIAMAPEGNRTYSGRTMYMRPAVVTLARKLKLPIALYRIEGGYGVQPRWSDGVRKGKIHAYVSRVIEPDEYAAMTNDELLAAIETELSVDEAAPGGLFHSERRAEYLERAMYVCPWCGLSEFESSGNTAGCKRCGRGVQYGADRRLRGVDCDFPFDYVGQWYDYQEDFVRGLDMTQYTETPLYTDRARLSEVIVYRRKHLLRKNAELRLYGDRVVIDEGSGEELILPFDQVTAAAVLGRNKLNLYHGGVIYQVKGGKRFNALKYVNIYFQYKNSIGGNSNGKFLGL